MLYLLLVSCQALAPVARGLYLSNSFWTIWTLEGLNGFLMTVFYFDSYPFYLIGFHWPDFPCVQDCPGWTWFAVLSEFPLTYPSLL